jgi:hypothetical protein
MNALTLKKSDRLIRETLISECLRLSYSGSAGNRDRGRLTAQC